MRTLNVIVAKPAIAGAIMDCLNSAAMTTRVALIFSFNPNGTLDTFINAKISAPSGRKTLKESSSVCEGLQRLNLLYQIFPCRTGKYLEPAVEKFRS